MRRDELVTLLQASPFQPFRLHLSNGVAFDVRHPEMLMVARHAAIVGISESGENGDSGHPYPEIERFATVDLLHVTHVEELQRRST